MSQARRRLILTEESKAKYLPRIPQVTVSAGMNSSYRDTRAPPFSWQTIETIDSKGLEFPQGVLCWEKRELKPGAKQRRNLSPRKWLHTILTTCHTPRWRHWNTGWWPGPHLQQDCPDMHAPWLIFKHKPQIRIPKMDLVRGAACGSLHPFPQMWPHWIHFFSQFIVIICLNGPWKIVGQT